MFLEKFYVKTATREEKIKRDNPSFIKVG